MSRTPTQRTAEHDNVADDDWVDPEIVERYVARGERRYCPPGTRRPTTAERHAIARACHHRGAGITAICRALRLNSQSAHQLINNAQEAS